MQDGKKQAPKGVGDWRRGKRRVFFPFCLFAAPPPALFVLATLARRKQENNGVIYGNLAALSNLALTG